ncbi:hypothetical protein NX059_002078 [Plenodomus lindquistii]|nr:hypothetical protein NX059_002078 [Plenodomus lindquistii]
MLSRQLSQASSWRGGSICLFCAARSHLQTFQLRPFATTNPLSKNRETPSVVARRARRRIQKIKEQEGTEVSGIAEAGLSGEDVQDATPDEAEGKSTKQNAGKVKGVVSKDKDKEKTKSAAKDSKAKGKTAKLTKADSGEKVRRVFAKQDVKEEVKQEIAVMSLKEALLAREDGQPREPLNISVMFPDNLEFTPVEVDKPPVPMLSYGLDRVLFNPGVYRLQDPRSRVYNFDPYLEKIMPVSEFDFDALSEYKTSSKDEELLRITENTGAKFTGSTSSMSGILQHFHYVLSNFRGLNHEMLSRDFPKPSEKFSRITLGPSAVFLRYKNGVYAIDADKSYDRPNIMSWLGHSLEKLLTTERSEFERFRKSNVEESPSEDNSSRCYHYSRQGNILMRSQLDAYDPRLPGTGVFDLKTRAVVSIRMNHRKYQEGSGYQIRHSLGQWESYEREFYDMTRATLLKYSLQVRMGRMDGIFIAFHNIERIFGFQYLSLADMDEVLHGTRDTHMGDQEFKLSIALVDEILTKATAAFPNTTLRLHVEARQSKTPFMYVFAEPVTDEQADEIQNAGEAAQKEFARNVIGVGKNDPKTQVEWQKTQHEVDEQLVEDQQGTAVTEGTDAEAEVEAEPEEEETVVEQEEAETLVGQEEAETEIEQEEAETKVEQADAENVDGEISAETTTEEGEEADAEVEGEAEVKTEATKSPNPEQNQLPSGPLIGWTLTVRSKVNQGYVDRPQKIDENDDWNIEYNLQEIPEANRWSLYNAVKKRRHELIGQDEEEADKSLKNYRDVIQRYSDRGRQWRIKQDKINDEMGVTIYKPLGPGSGSGSYVDGSWVLDEAFAVKKDMGHASTSSEGATKTESEAKSPVDANAGEPKAEDTMSKKATEEVLEELPSVPS